MSDCAEGRTYLFDLDFNLGNDNIYTVSTVYIPGSVYTVVYSKYRVLLCTVLYTVQAKLKSRTKFEVALAHHAKYGKFILRPQQ